MRLPTLLVLALSLLATLAATAAAAPPWAFEETFSGDPAAPSSDLLPRSFDYVATHRTHPRSPDGVAPDGSYGSYPADHGPDCAGPPSQHMVSTGHRSTSRAPDGSFFVCKNHMMSSMGHVEGYSVSAFWPRQEFDFAGGGTLEWDININDGHPRSWTEVMIVPRQELQLAPAQEFLPIDETYPARRILLQINPQTARWMHVGATAPPAAPLAEAEQDAWGRPWNHAGDPALTDRRIRRTNRLRISGDTLVWGLETADGTFDELTLKVPGGVPFTRGLVVFKTHAYTPEKDGNTNLYTYHWDNIRFSGPALEPYQVSEKPEVVNLAANGDKPIGSRHVQTIDLPADATNPVLMAQINAPRRGQVQVDVNGRGTVTLEPHYGFSDARCEHSGWATVRAELDPAWLIPGRNTLTWTVAPAACGGGQWDGYAAKGVEIQYNGAPPVDPPARPSGGSGPPEIAGCAPVPPAATPGAPGSVRLTSAQLRINQRIGAAAIRRANAIQRWLDDGLIGADICAGSLSAANLAAGTTTTAGSASGGPAATPRALKVVPSAPTATPARFTVSAGQLEINQRIYSAAVRRANALRQRLDGRLTGGDIRDGTLAPDRLGGLTVSAFGGAPVPASRTRLAPAPRRDGVRFARSVAQLRTNQKIAQAAVRRTNDLRRLLARGLTGENFAPRSISGSDWARQ